MTTDGKTPTDQEVPDPRPRPAYGEYAPEGWEWTPPGEAAPPSSSSSSPASQRPRGNTPTSTPPGGGTGRLPGVPHNLGARGSVSSEVAEASRPATATDETNNSQHYRATPGQPGAVRSAGGRRLGDRIVTIVLLVVGALGALNSAASLYSMSNEFERWGRVLEVGGFSVPASLTTLGTVGALLVLAVYALNVIYSVQRLRARKLTFWVPLVAAVLAGIITFTFIMIGIYQVPELLQRLAEPDAMELILSSLSAPQ